MGAPLRPGAPQTGTASGAADDTEAHVWGRLRRASGLVGPGRASVTGGASRRLPPTGQEDVGEVAAEGRGARGALRHQPLSAQPSGRGHQQAPLG